MPLQPSQKRRASRRVRTLDTIGWTVVTVSVAFVAYLVASAFFVAR